jgi:hypothetical protein
MLVDLIASLNASNDPGCSSINGVTPTAFPSSTVGFFVCVNGSIAELHLAASALDTQANTGLRSSVSSAERTTSAATSRFADKAKYGIVSQA